MAGRMSSTPRQYRRAEPGRLNAWMALSELFLDADLDEKDIESISRRLRTTGYGITELEQIYEEEVAPVCWRNHGALPGGVWARFDPNWLAQSIDRHCEGDTGFWPRLGWLRRRRIDRWTASSRTDWERVKRRLAQEEPTSK